MAFCVSVKTWHETIYCFHTLDDTVEYVMIYFLSESEVKGNFFEGKYCLFEDNNKLFIRHVRENQSNQEYVCPLFQEDFDGMPTTMEQLRQFVKNRNKITIRLLHTVRAGSTLLDLPDEFHVQILTSDEVKKKKDYERWKHSEHYEYCHRKEQSVDVDEMMRCCPENFGT